MRSTKVCVVGLGYIGLPTAVMFANAGLEVVGVDVNLALIADLNNRTYTVWEPSLAALLAQALDSGRLRVQERAESADAFLLCVPTPINPDHTADLSYVEAATRAILPYLKSGDLVVLESTVPPGCTDTLVAGIIREAGLDPYSDIHLAHCPERVLPGNIVNELVNNGRCLGGMTPEAAERSRDLYATFVKGPLLITDARTAELAKLMENTYRDVNIALANEFARICSEIGINVWEAIQLANQHPRVNILRPGPGVGGHCIAVDPYFIIEQCPEQARLISCSREINSGMPNYVVELIRARVGAAPATVALFGLAYKADSDDVRESPAVEVVEALLDAGYIVRVHDPLVGVRFPYMCESPLECVQGADIAVLLTDHRTLRTLDPSELKSHMRSAVSLDTRNGWSGEEWTRAGFDHLALGDGQKVNTWTGVKA